MQKQVLLNDEFNKLYITYCYLLVYHFEILKKREYLDTLRDLIQNKTILFNQEEYYYIAVIIYGLTEMKRKLAKAQENPVYILQIQNITESKQLKSIVNRLLSQQVIDCLKQQQQFPSIWLYLSQFLCAWILLEMKSMKALQRQERQEKEGSIRHEYVQCCQIIAASLVENKINLNFKEFLQIIFNMKTIDFKIAALSQQKEKNFLFLQQILLKWQTIDQIYFPNSQSNVLINNQNEEDQQAQAKGQSLPQDCNQIFTDKIMNKIERYSEDVSRGVLDILNQYRQKEETNQIGWNHNNRLKSLHPFHRDSTLSLEQIDQNPKIQVFDSDQLLQVEIMVSSKNINLDESISFQTNTKEGATFMIRNIIQNELSNTKDIPIGSFHHPNIYEIEEKIMELHKFQGKKTLNLEELFDVNINNGENDKGNANKQQTLNKLQSFQKKELNFQNQQQQNISQGINNLLNKWKNTSQNKFLNYKKAESQIQQMTRYSIYNI